LIGWVLRIYPERLNWLTIPNIIFEVAAFMVAAVGGIKIGLSIFSSADFYLEVN
jgi:uncharacterized membrane protein SpoIIM required for sporulation